MKNIHSRLLLVIACAIAVAVYLVVTKPTKMGLDIQGGMRVVLQADTSKMVGEKWDPNTHLANVALVMRNRVDALGVAEPQITPKPPDQIVVELPGLKNHDEALAMIKTTALMEFRYVPELDKGGAWTTKKETTKASDGTETDTGYETIIGPDGKPVSPEELQAKVFDQPPVLTGKDLKSNSKADIANNQYIIHFEFKDDAKGTFEDFTRSHINKTLAIFLDKRLISAPNINGVIPGTGIIEGNFTADSAKTLADQLNAGALPVPLKVVQDTQIDATLGNKAVHQTLIAGIVGLALVLVFMVWRYKMPGVLSDIALVLYTLFTFAVFKLIPVVLTIPGIAGFILSIGMAVDANILIFERMREERLSGKSIRASIEAGFKRAFTAIFDSNVCTLITCYILYTFGTGQVKGFALTLAIGVIISLFTAVTCSRTFLLLVAGTDWGQNDNLYSLERGLHPSLNVSKKIGFWFAVSGIVIVPGLIFWLGFSGTRYSIEFTSGSEINVQFEKQPSTSAINSALASIGHKESRVVMGGQGAETWAFITTKELSDADKAEITATLRDKVGPIAKKAPSAGAPAVENITYSRVSPVISRELTLNAFKAVVYASVLIILYLAFRFSIPNFYEGLKFGTCAVIALLHDVLVVWGVFAIFGYFLQWQVDSLFVTALLTVIGFSVHDTIIIFDRIRENLHHKERGETFAHVSDRSIEQTFARSVYTSGTVVITLLALLLFGGPVIRIFVTALLIGVISGTYSSIFNATPALILWKQLTGDRDRAVAVGPVASRPAPRKAEPVRPKISAPRPSTAPTAVKPSEPGPSEAAADSGAKKLKPKKPKRRM